VQPRAEPGTWADPPTFTVLQAEEGLDLQVGRWAAGVLACWVLACWRAGVLACWRAGVLACWRAGAVAVSWRVAAGAVFAAAAGERLPGGLILSCRHH
jgi:hypothetical protein